MVSDMKKTLRTGKVLVDWSQNDEHKTTVAVYSLRARASRGLDPGHLGRGRTLPEERRMPELLVFEFVPDDCPL